MHIIAQSPDICYEVLTNGDFEKNKSMDSGVADELPESQLPGMQSV